MKLNVLRACIAVLSLLIVPGAFAADFGTREEARAMLDRVVVAVKADPEAALAKFNAGEDGFKDRDLYPFCVGSDGIMSAHPTLLGKAASEIKDPDGKMVVEEMMKVAEEGKVAEVEYKWPRPDSTEPLPKVSYVTKIGDQVCGVGYYEQ
jgi:signal transduction histidine kinase